MIIGGVPEGTPRGDESRYEQLQSRTLRSSALTSWELQPTSRPLRLVVVETQALAWRAHVAHEHDQTVLLVRGRAESLSTFSLRAAQRVVALERDQQAIRLALMLLAPRFDTKASASRLLLARALIASATDRATKLVLCAEHACDPKVQAQLMAFVELLMRQPSSWNLTVQVKFGPQGAWRPARTRESRARLESISAAAEGL